MAGQALNEAVEVLLLEANVVNMNFIVLIYAHLPACSYIAKVKPNAI